MGGKFLDGEQHITSANGCVKMKKWVTASEYIEDVRQGYVRLFNLFMDGVVRKMKNSDSIVRVEKSIHNATLNTILYVEDTYCGQKVGNGI